MEEIFAFREKLEDWVERMLLKGIRKFESADLATLARLEASAREYGMDFLAELIARLSEAGGHYMRDAKAGVELLTERYLYMVQYVNMMKKPLSQAAAD
ncbi:hypothetical protein [Brevibacillus parabrevis]|uniref:hypothetical protein n=1 Tax=Brevibacillus parabrevis TaxID=54914 RepID=UPI00113E883D|nr:hypothetical protein [Brevibacillus parabrevis]MED1724453.1 hypothetical protein [Brevibacillus parabrevis]TGU91443.1 hypothetical protein EN829_060985 [Mesorhizobium sp. M00.F.Ca.ET.186.01.1.1]